MAKAIALRADHGGGRARGRLARASRDAAQTRRLLALVRDPGRREPNGGGADRRGRPPDHPGLGAALQRRGAGGPGWTATRRASRTLTEDARAYAPSLAHDQVEAGPEPDLHGVVRWRLVDSGAVAAGRRSASRSRPADSIEPRELSPHGGFRKLSARPRDRAQDPEAIEAFKKNLPAELAAIRGRIPEGVAHRAVAVQDRGAGRPEERHARADGHGARNQAPRERTTMRTRCRSLHLRRHLPGQGKGRGPGE